MSDAMPTELEETIKDNPPEPSEDSLQSLRKMIAEVRDLEFHKANLEQQAKELGTKLNEFYFRKLPELMDGIGVSRMTIDGTGNYPPIEARVKPFYAANISAKWPDDKRLKSFAWLDKHKHGDLIKTEVVAQFPRDKRKLALAFAKEAKKKKYGASPVIKQSVHSGTLTAWLREQIEDKHNIPPLDIIGGTVSRFVELKEKKS